ncbi:MAG: aminotransferase class I/II-fold pyridoxal phosphate-dependent enzyme [bacterium]
MANLKAPELVLQPVSVTRKMSASLPRLRDIAQKKGLKIHHLGAGYPHPEVTDPRGFIAHQNAYFAHLQEREGLNDPDVLPEYLRESFSYGDTLGPRTTREVFARVYGADWDIQIDVSKLIPTVGATGGINLMCSLAERPGTPVAYITDAPTYAGFTARVSLCHHARIFSVDMDEEGALPDQFRAQIHAARAQGFFVPFYYTVPDGHNPAGFSFSQARRETLLQIAREEGILIVEDAPYLYINFAPPESRPKPFFAMAPELTVHLFTGSKIGFPGPRVGFLYSQASLEIAGGRQVDLAEMALTEASSDILFQNPAALRGFEALLHDAAFEPISSMWLLAEQKLGVYRENREILLSVLQERLGPYPEHFSWTQPEAGFFSVFTFRNASFETDDAFIESLVAEYGVVAIPMYDFYPADAKARDPRAGLNQLRLSFCFSESKGEARRTDMREAIAAFCDAALDLTGLRA